MCGIVGYLGSRNSVDKILTGLGRLEYRGYDSAGICLFRKTTQELTNYKKAGKLTNLEQFIAGMNLQSNIGIGHTRWATHGAVNDENAHPHQNEKVAIVHNGIIENSDRLKMQLKDEGHRFDSETDSEVFLALVSKYYKGGEIPLIDAVSNAFEEVEGNSAFVIMRDGDRELIAVKRGAPLVCGKSYSVSEGFVSSDPYALLGYVDELVFPEDGVFCHLQMSDDGALTWNFVESDGSNSRRIETKTANKETESLSKGQFEHYMLKEIYEQPHLIRTWMGHYLSGQSSQAVKQLVDINYDRVHLTACGTAYYAGLLIKRRLEQVNKAIVNTEVASEFRYNEPNLKPGDIGLFISQSGETADTLAAQTLCKEQNIDTFSIVNVEGSSLFRSCTENLLIHAGVEIGVASTKAFTLQVLTGYIFSELTNSDIDITQFSRRVGVLADRIEELLENVDKIKKVAEEIYNYKGYLFTGRGAYYPVALEGALKLKEIAYVHAEGYAAGELKHGPIALIDEQMVNIAIVGPELYEKTLSNLEEIKARKGVIVAIGPENDDILKSKSDHFIGLNFEGVGELSPLYVNVVNQLLSYYMAKFKGTDIDKPRNLAKSVTVE